MDWQAISTFLPKPDYSFDGKTIDVITKHRKELGSLFFDRIWISLGLTPQPQKVYPPKTNQELKNLCQNIIKADQITVDERKYAILYYILRDARQGGTSSKGGANHHGDARFANAVFLPQKYQALISGLWELDHLHFNLALTHLTDPCLGSDFSADVMEVLLVHPKSDTTMALGYYIAKSPLMTDPQLVQKVFQLLLETNTLEAYKFSQRQVEYQEQLFEHLIGFILSEEDGMRRAESARLLVSLPLSSQEEEWLEEFLLHGNGSKLFGARDTVIMRRIARGKTLDGTANIADKNKGQKATNINWDIITAELQKTTG